MQYDLVVVLILVLATIHGSYRGFVSQLATVAALILAFACAGPVSTQLAPFISLQPPLDRWVAMLAAYVVLSLGCFIVARSLREGIEKAKLTEYDRHLGGVFGFVKGCVFCLVLTFFLVTLFEGSRSYIIGTAAGHPSKTGYLSALILDRLYPIVPAQFAQAVDGYLHRYDGTGVPFEHKHEDDHEQAHQHAHADDDGHQHAGAIAGPPGSAPRIADGTRHTHDAAAPGAGPVRQAGPVENRINNPSNALGAERTLLSEIIALYAWDAGEHSRLLADVEAALAELPAAAAAAVVRDWHADLLDPLADPDPETDARWSLGERMLRQLSLADEARRANEPLRRTARNPRP